MPKLNMNRCFGRGKLHGSGKDIQKWAELPLELEDFESALERHKSALRRFPDFALNFRTLVVSLKKTGRAHEALSFLHDLIQLAVDRKRSVDQAALHQLLWISLELKNFDEALFAIEVARGLQDEVPVGIYQGAAAFFFELENKEHQKIVFDFLLHEPVRGGKESLSELAALFPVEQGRGRLCAETFRTLLNETNVASRETVHYRLLSVYFFEDDCLPDDYRNFIHELFRTDRLAMIMFLGKHRPGVRNSAIVQYLDGIGNRRYELADLSAEALLVLYTLIVVFRGDRAESFREELARICRSLPDSPLCEAAGVLQFILRNSATNKTFARSAEGACGNRKPRIALCVSGQLRGFREARKTWEVLFNGGHEITTYVHTWKRQGFNFAREFSSKALGKAYSDAVKAYGLEGMRMRYPAFMSRIEGNAEVSIEELKEAYKTDFIVIEDDTLARFSGMRNAEKMYYKIEACHNLARLNGDADIVIRIRPDLSLGFPGESIDWERILRESIRHSAIFTSGPPMITFNTHGIDDRFAVGYCRLMDAYSSAWTTTKFAKTCGIYGFPTEMWGHEHLAKMTLLHGIEVRGSDFMWAGELLNGTSDSVRLIRDSLISDLQGKDLRPEDKMLLESCEQEPGV